MKREKIRLEYLLNATSKNILWSAISTPTGLEDWFADKVVSNDKIVEFHWGKTEQRDAEITAIRAYSFIRFRWLDDENERDYFEITSLSFYYLFLKTRKNLFAFIYHFYDNSIIRNIDVNTTMAVFALDYPVPNIISLN